MWLGSGIGKREHSSGPVRSVLMLGDAPRNRFFLPSARSGSIFGNGQVLVMRTVKDRAYSLSQLVSCEQSVRLDHLALTMDPLGLHRVEPRALFGQKAAYDPHSTAAVFDFPVVRSEPLSDLFGDVPRSIVPDQNPNPFARRFKPFAAPRKEAGVGSTGRCNTIGFWCCLDRRCASGETGSSWRVVGGG